MSIFSYLFHLNLFINYYLITFKFKYPLKTYGTILTSHYITHQHNLTIHKIF